MPDQERDFLLTQAPPPEGKGPRLGIDRLDYLLRNNSGWRMLRSNNVILVVGFLHTVFVEPNKRSIQESDLAEALD